MIESIVEFTEQAMSSPWVYVLLFAIAAIDGFFPAVPGETLVITAGVFAAASDMPNLALVIAAAALGAFAGDHVSYAIGRGAGGKLLAKVRLGSRQDAAFGWARTALAERGGLVLVICRYIPGCRTAVTLTTGALSYPLRRFSFFDGIAALSWALYSALIGYLGGMAFENDPLKGLLLGFGIAVGLTVLVELVRYLRKRRAAPASPEEPARVGASS